MQLGVWLPGHDTREAARLACRYLRILEALAPEDRRAEILTFHRRTIPEILRLVQNN